MATPANRLLTPSMLVGIIGVTVVAYAVHTTSWIVHEVRGGGWVRWLELVYLATLIIWLGGFALTVVARKHLRRTSPRTAISDERTNLLFLRAHQVALITVLLAQIPFFFLAVPAYVLAQLTVTTAVVSLFGSYVWLDRWRVIMDVILHNNIKVERARRNLTQEQLAELAGVTRKTINTIETGRFVPSTVLALKLAKVFGVRVEDLFELGEEKSSTPDF